MAMCIFKKNLKKYLNRYRRPALCGLAAGFLCGLFGSGGGALLLSVLRKQTDEKDLPSLYATCASAILPLSLFSVSTESSEQPPVIFPLLFFCPLSAAELWALCFSPACRRKSPEKSFRPC